MRLREVENFASQSVRAMSKGEIAIRPTAAERPRFTIDEEAKAARDRLADARAEKRAEIVLTNRKREELAVERNAQARAAEAHHQTSKVAQDRAGRAPTKETSPSPATVSAAKPLDAAKVPNQADDTAAAGPTDDAGTAASKRKVAASKTESDSARPNDIVAPHPGQPTSGAAPVVPRETGIGADGGQDRSEGGSAGSEHEAANGEGKPPDSQAEGATQNAAATPPQPGAALGSDRAGATGQVSAGETSAGVEGVGGSSTGRAASADRSGILSDETREDSEDGKAADKGDIAASQSGEARAADPAGALSSGSSPVPPSPATAPPASPPVPHQGPPVPLGAVPMTIGLRSLAGSSHFEIRLDPVDLGRIDVRLEIDKEKGTVTTKVVVERPETLALLRRDADNLQQALSQAGLDPGAGISLSLRDDGTSGGAGSGDRPFEGRQPASGDGRPSAPTSAIDTAAPRMLRGIAGIDIRI